MTGDGLYNPFMVMTWGWFLTLALQKMTVICHDFWDP